MADIKYVVRIVKTDFSQETKAYLHYILKNVFTLKRSSRGLIPWIKLNDYIVEDSQFIIDYLSKVYNKDLNKDLTEEQKAIGRCVLKTNEESLKW